MTNFKSAILTSCVIVFVGLAIPHGPSAFTTTEPPSSAVVAQKKQKSGWVERTLRRMKLEEKIGQMIMARANGTYFSAASDSYERLNHLVRGLKVGGFVFFRGDVYETAVLINRLQSKADVPLLIAADMERGVAMRVRRATPFPDAMALGATRDPGLAEQMGEVIAREGRALGIHQNYAPVVDLNNNPKNPVINVRSFGEDPTLVSRLTTAFIRGLQKGGMIATVKHFPGHGDTEIDSHLGLPVMPFTRGRLDSLELVPFKEAINAGVGSVMVAHLALPNVDTTGIPATLSPVVVQQLLRSDLHFNGLIVTDALEMAAVVTQFSVAEIAVRAVKAGSDLLLLPADEEHSIRTVAAAVQRGEISESRIDESVRRILSTKASLGLPEHRQVNLRLIPTAVGTRAHLGLAKDIARRSITIVKNDSSMIPLQARSTTRTACVVVSDAEDYRTEVNRASNPYQNERVGDYFIAQLRSRTGVLDTYRVDSRSDRADFDSILASVRSADLIVCPTYVRLRTATGKIGLPDSLKAFLQSITTLGKPFVLVSLGSPYVIADVPGALSMVCAYSDNEFSVEAAVEALFGEIPVSGRLPISVPGLAPVESGLELPKVSLRRDDPERVGFDRKRLEALDQVVKEAIRDSAFPSAQLLVAKNGVVVLHKAYGTYDYSPFARLVDRSTLYDLASLTKVIATTTSVMKLYDDGKIQLDSTVAKYLPEFAQNGKERVTVRNLLLHNSGLPAYRRFFLTCKSPQQLLDSIYAAPLEFGPGDSTLYSDLGMIALGKVIERIAGQPLDQFVNQQIFRPLGMVNTMYNPPGELAGRIAPTEIDTTWRKMLVRGQVHDENAAALGGVSGHAGIFSTAGDLATFVQMVLNGGTYGGRRYLSESTVRLFTSAQAGSPRALGWDRKSQGYSSAGSLFSDESFGHTGFTGTSIWVDPKRELLVIFLTNRVYPTRDNKKIYLVRPALHDAVIHALREG